MQIRELTSVPGGAPAALRAGARTLMLPRSALKQLEAEALAAHPDECCGALIGEVLEAAVGVLEARPAPNVSADPRRRYEIDPRVVRALDAAAAGAGLAVVGYYHSHPGRAAEPSSTDLELALPGLTYLILGMASGGAFSARAWRIAEDRSRFDEQELQVV